MYAHVTDWLIKNATYILIFWIGCYKYSIYFQDMNEPANFADGEQAKARCNMSNKLNSPPYIPGEIEHSGCTQV